MRSSDVGSSDIPSNGCSGNDWRDFFCSARFFSAKGGSNERSQTGRYSARSCKNHGTLLNDSLFLNDFSRLCVFVLDSLPVSSPSLACLLFRRQMLLQHG